MTERDAVLVFVDSLGLGELVCEQLESCNRNYIKVELGNAYSQISANHYVLNPRNKQHYQFLLKTLTSNKVFISDILHLWNYEEYNGKISSIEDLESAQQQGLYSLLFLVQAIEQQQGIEHPIQLLFVASHSQSLVSTDLIAYEKATVLGLLKTISQEMPWFRCRHIDLPITQNEDNTAYLLQEFCVLSQEGSCLSGRKTVCLSFRKSEL